MGEMHGHVQCYQPNHGISYEFQMIQNDLSIDGGPTGIYLALNKTIRTTKQDAMRAHPVSGWIHHIFLKVELGTRKHIGKSRKSFKVILKNWRSILHLDIQNCQTS